MTTITTTQLHQQTPLLQPTLTTTNNIFKRVDVDSFNINWGLIYKDKDKFVRFETDKNKIVSIHSWKIQERIIREEPRIEFHALCSMEDGQAVSKEFSTTSFYFKKRLQELLQDSNPNIPVTLSITKIGERFNTLYNVVMIKK